MHAHASRPGVFPGPVPGVVQPSQARFQVSQARFQGPAWLETGREILSLARLSGPGLIHSGQQLHIRHAFAVIDRFSFLLPFRVILPRSG
jgi:hypothetical protein